MIQILITDEERELLVDLLENDIAELRMEISDTHRKEYRDMLKHRESLLKSIQQKVEQAAAEKIPA